jgi:hypothetical protein
MLVNVTINRESNGKIKISVIRSRPWNASRAKGLDCSEARGVLIAFGFSTVMVDKQMEKIKDYGPKERIDLGDKDVQDNILKANGLRP